MTQTNRSLSGRITRRFIIFGLVMLSLLIGGLVCLPMLMFGGQHYGMEFSPDDFSRRSYEYRILPFFNTTISGIKYSPVKGGIGSKLVGDKLITPLQGTNKTWHLLYGSGYRSGNEIARDCDARLLADCLDKTDEDGNIWSKWNTKFPGCAKVFWPIVAKMARDEMYLKLPDLMEFAMQCVKDDPVTFTKHLNETASKAYLELGQLDIELNQPERAKYRLKISDEIVPNKPAKSLLKTL